MWPRFRPMGSTISINNSQLTSSSISETNNPPMNAFSNNRQKKRTFTDSLTATATNIISNSIGKHIRNSGHRGLEAAEETLQIQQSTRVFGWSRLYRFVVYRILSIIILILIKMCHLRKWALNRSENLWHSTTFDQLSNEVITYSSLSFSP